MPDTVMSLSDQGKAWLKQGLAVIPVKSDGSKRPAIDWEKYQTNLPTPALIDDWMSKGWGLGLCTGRVEMFEFEGRAMNLLPAFQDRLKATPHPTKDGTMFDVWKRIFEGCAEKSPSGGLHVFYSLPAGVAEKSKNTRLCSRPATPDELKEGEKASKAFRVEIETRSAGGYSVIAPTPGWSTLSGGPGSLAKLTEKEREALFDVARSLSTWEALRLKNRTRRTSKTETEWAGGVTWEQILSPHGWEIEKSDENGIVYWRHPSINRGGHGATVGANGTDMLYVFSTSTEFEADQYYSKLDAIALLEHGGNVATAREKLNLGVDPEEFFEGELGLLTTELTKAILEIGPLALGERDRNFWYYDPCGVWRPGRHEVNKRAPKLLDYRYRTSHVSNAEGSIREHLDLITCEPVPQYVNFKNGLYDWAADKLIEHTDEVMTINQLTVNYNPDTVCYEVDKFIESIVNPDDIERVWEIIGYLLYSGNPLQVAFLFRGEGRNGKGTLLRVIENILGRDNYSSVTLDSINENRFASSELFGKMANIAGDIDATYMTKTANFKKITGEDEITAERKNQDAFQFTAWATCVFSANEQFGSSDTTDGFVARWELLEFPNTFVGKEDRGLTDRLRAESEGVAFKAMAALRNVINRGYFLETESSKKAKEEFVTAIDPVYRWIEEECIDFRGDGKGVDPNQRIGGEDLRGHLYDRYRDEWCVKEGTKPLARDKFFRKLKNKGFELIHGKGGGWYFRGLRLKLPQDLLDEVGA